MKQVSLKTESFSNKTGKMTEEEFNKILETLKSDLNIYDEMIKEVSAEMVAEGFTKYPVFIASSNDINFGELIIDKNDMAGTFHVFATTMEEMIDKNLILENKRNDFVKAYKDPKKFMCILLLTDTTASFIFSKYKVVKEDEGMM